MNGLSGFTKDLQISEPHSKKHRISLNFYTIKSILKKTVWAVWAIF